MKIRVIEDEIMRYRRAITKMEDAKSALTDGIYYSPDAQWCNRVEEICAALYRAIELLESKNSKLQTQKEIVANNEKPIPQN